MNPHQHPSTPRRRGRRVLAVGPLAVALLAVLVGTPLRPAAEGARPGTMHQSIVSLTGADGRRTTSGAAAPAAAPTGWTTEVDVANGSQSVGVSWSGAPHGAVSVRGFDGRAWSAWTLLEADPNDGPDRRGAAPERDAGGLAWFGGDGVESVQLRVERGPLQDLDLQAMRYDAPDGSASVVPADGTAGAATNQPTILPRSMWTTKGWASGNSGCSSGPQTAPDGLKFGVIHHTGGHAAGFNTGSVGVSFLGQFEPGATPTATQPTSAALDAAGRLLGWKLGSAGIDPTGTVTVTSGGGPRYPAGTKVTIPRIVGHRDVGYTACPGANLYAKLATIRATAKANVANTTTTTTTTTSTTVPGTDPTDAPGATPVSGTSTYTG